MAKTQKAKATKPKAKKIEAPKPKATIIKQVSDQADLYAQADKVLTNGKIQVTSNVLGFFNKGHRQTRKYRGVAIEVVD